MDRQGGSHVSYLFGDYVPRVSADSIGQRRLTQAFASSLPSPAAFPAVHGTVLIPTDAPASGIHVELDDAATAVPVTSTYTERDGTFELYNIPQGNYEVVAE